MRKNKNGIGTIVGCDLLMSFNFLCQFLNLANYKILILLIKVASNDKKYEIVNHILDKARRTKRLLGCS